MADPAPSFFNNEVNSKGTSWTRMTRWKTLRPKTAPGLKGSADAVHFVRAAFKHAKPIAASDDGADFLVGAGVIASPTQAVAGLSTAADPADGALANRFIANIALHRHWGRV